MAQSVKRPTLDFWSGLDIMVIGSSLMSGSALTAQRLLMVLSGPPLLVRSLSRSLSFYIHFIKHAR